MKKTKREAASSSLDELLQLRIILIVATKISKSDFWGCQTPEPVMLRIGAGMNFIIHELSFRMKLM